MNSKVTRQLALTQTDQRPLCRKLFIIGSIYLVARHATYEGITGIFSFSGIDLRHPPVSESHGRKTDSHARFLGREFLFFEVPRCYLTWPILTPRPCPRRTRSMTTSRSSPSSRQHKRWPMTPQRPCRNTPNQRELLRLRHEESLMHREIALRLGRAMGTVASTTEVISDRHTEHYRGRADRAARSAALRQAASCCRSGLTTPGQSSRGCGPTSTSPPCPPLLRAATA